MFQGIFRRRRNSMHARPPAARRLHFQTLERRLLLSVVNWTGGGDGKSWSDAANWSGGALPDSTSDVMISAPAGATVTHASGTDSIKSLTASSPLTLSGGTLTVSGTVEVDNTFTLSGGTLASACRISRNPCRENG
jgi:hypothetical protein